MARNPDYLDSMTFIDRSGEKGTVTIHVDSAAVQGVKDAYSAAVRALSDMLYIGNQRSTTYRDTSAAIGTGQREDKYLVTYMDNTTLAQYSFAIPGRDDVAYTTLPGTDMYSLLIADNPDMATFVTAFQAYAKSPDGGNVTVLSIRAVGRNI